MRKDKFRNIAIIAHVDHGKTTLVDGMLKQGGAFKDHQVVEERVMDSGDIEKERGITITAKNTTVQWKNTKINILDTPGHADFGGEVERSLSMVDGVILLVDASEGPMPQTRYVLKKALSLSLPVILVINKIDKPDRRIDEVINEVYDLFIDLDANDEQIEFPILYAIAKAGTATTSMDVEGTDLSPLFDMILEEFEGPEANDDMVPQFLVTNLDYDAYVGQIAVGRLFNGKLAMNKQYTLCKEDENIKNVKFSALYTYQQTNKVKIDEAESGDIIALSGVDNVSIGDTISDLENPLPLPAIRVDEPTVSMLFYVNDGPFAGLEGKFLTSAQIKNRLEKEILTNVSLKVEATERADVFKVSGRGELQMAVLIETMRREGFELMVSRPTVIFKEIDGKKCEPFERVFIDTTEDTIGIITEKLSYRKGRLENLINHGSGRVNMEFVVPTRGLIGYRSQFLTDTRGSGVMNTLFEEFAPHCGKIEHRQLGVIVSDREGKVTSFASLAMEDRGQRIVEVGKSVYSGMVVGERNRPGDLEINITKEKKLTNMRSSSADATVVLRACKLISLDEAIEFIDDDELVEVTPETVRIRKRDLDKNAREAAQRKKKVE